MSGKAQRGSTVSFGDFGLQAIDRARLTARQIEARAIAMTRHVKRGGKIWIRIFPDKPITKKPAETRMGKGKGNPGGMGRRREAGADPLRDGRRAARDRQGGVAPRRAQAARADSLRAAGGVLMKASELRELTRGRAPLEVARAARGALQRAHEEGDGSAREQGQARTAAPRHRAGGDGASQRAGGDAVSKRGQRRTLIGRGGERQDGQDRRGARGAPRQGPAVPEVRALATRSSWRTTRRTPARSATACASSSTGRSRSASAGRCRRRSSRRRGSSGEP